MSKVEEEFDLHLRAEGIKGFEREVRFHPVRRWRFDFANEDLMIAVEIQGLTYYGGKEKAGRHQTAKGIEGDLEKYDEAMRLGWSVYQCSQKMVRSGKAIETLKILIGLKK